MNGLPRRNPAVHGGSIILLISAPTPSFLPNKEFLPPTGLLYLAGVLQANGENVRLIDMNVFKGFDLLHVIEAIGPSLIGFGCLFSGQFVEVLNHVRAIKKVHPLIPIVLGGLHATIFARDIMENCPEIDYLVLGEGEEVFLDLVRYALGKRKDLPTNGIAHRIEGIEAGIIVRPKTKWIDKLDSLPFPAYNLINFENYRHDTSHWHNPKRLPIGISVPIISSRSCPNACCFCSMHLIGGRKYRARSPENVVAEIEYLYHAYGIRHFCFMDDNLTFDKRRIIAICGLIVKRQMNLQFECRNGLMIRTLDRDVIEAMSSAGWVRGAVAIESGNDYIRNKIMHKNISEKQIYKTIALIRQQQPKIWLKAFFIMGMPEDTEKTLQDSYNMLKRLDIDEVYMTPVVPYPGAPLYDQAVRDNLFLVNTSSLWNNERFYMASGQFYIRTYTLNASQLMEWQRKFQYYSNRRDVGR